LISVQPCHNTRSSSMVTLARPPTRSSLKITNHFSVCHTLSMGWTRHCLVRYSLLHFHLSYMAVHHEWKYTVAKVFLGWATFLNRAVIKDWITNKCIICRKMIVSLQLKILTRQLLHWLWDVVSCTIQRLRLLLMYDVAVQWTEIFFAC